MKKVMLLAAFAVILGLSAPQVLNANPVQSKISKNIAISKNQKVKYHLISVNTVPKVVNNSFQKAYPGYTINKAFKNNEGTYKLDVSNKGTKQILYYKGNGEFIKAVKADSPMK